MLGGVVSTTVTTEQQTLEAPWASMTSKQTLLLPSGYGPGGIWRSVITSPGSGSNEPLSIEALAKQLLPAETVTFLHLATGGWLPAGTQTLVVVADRSVPFTTDETSITSVPGTELT